MPLNDETFKWFATLGVGGIVAAFMFLFYRKDVQFYTKLWQEQSQANSQVLSQVMQVIRDNTEALTKVVAVVDSLHRRLDSNGYSTKEFPTRDRDRH